VRLPLIPPALQAKRGPVFGSQRALIELIDDVDDADKRSDNDKYLDRRYRKAKAYEALDHPLTTTLDKSATLQNRVPDYLKASPELANWLSRWQAEDAKT
jgi:hypothetical protein